MTQNINNKTASSRILKWLIWTLLIFMAYYANRMLQSYWGQQTLDDTGLSILPLSAALSKAAKEQKLVLADMSAIWCSTCRKLDQRVFSNEKVQDVIKQYYVFARIEYESDEGQRFMQKYAVQGFPTVLILNAQGIKLHELPLSFEPIVYANLLSRAVQPSVE